MEIGIGRRPRCHLTRMESPEQIVRNGSWDRVNFFDGTELAAAKTAGVSGHFPHGPPKRSFPRILPAGSGPPWAVPDIDLPLPLFCSICISPSEATRGWHAGVCSLCGIAKNSFFSVDPIEAVALVWPWAFDGSDCVRAYHQNCASPPGCHLCRLIVWRENN